MPAGGAARKPAVIYIQGGPPRQMLLGWHYSDYYSNAYANNQYLASRGFVVLSVNFRLGIGYGYEFHQPPASGVRGASTYLTDRVAEAEGGGVDPRKIMVDPGIWFGKTLEHNLEILARLREFRALGKPIVIGVSRKSFIEKLTGHPAGQRVGGSVAAAVLAVRNGADVVRVHDVQETVDALRTSGAIASFSL